MADYLLYGDEIIKDDSTLESFAKSIFDNLDLHYSGDSAYDDYKESTMDYIEEHLACDISRTDIDYEDLMYRYRTEIGDLLYEMDNHGYDLDQQPLSFFGDKTKESFESLLYAYISIHFFELCL